MCNVNAEAVNALAKPEAQDLIELISDSPGISQARLAELCGGRKSVVAATLADLEASRIVAFDKGPRNAKLYRPTGLL